MDLDTYYQKRVDRAKKPIASKVEILKSIDVSSLNIKERALKKKMPLTIKPMLATLVQDPFNDPSWLFEIKWDGYRALAKIDTGIVHIYSRNNLEFNKKFPPIVKALASIKRNVVLDGEIVVVNPKGKSDFQLLQNFQRTGEGNIVYYVFDILYLDGYDLTNLPLLERKDILKHLLPSSDKIRFGDHIIAKGKEFFNLAKKNDLEGIIAKRLDSKYQMNKRSKDWLKIKIHLQQEAIICGFTEPRGSRQNFGALILGVYKNNKLQYIGHAGSGFDEAMLAEVMQKLKPLITKKSPFPDEPKTNMPATWVKPKLVCEVSFAEWTDDGSMRQPIFIGLREDKNPKDVKRELPEK